MGRPAVTARRRVAPAGADNGTGSRRTSRSATAPRGFDLSPDGREVWADNSHDRTVSAIDVSKKAVVDTLTIPTRMANRLKFTPDGKRVCISDPGDVVVIDAASRKEEKRIERGNGAAGILMQPDGPGPSSRPGTACR